jgi:hypothetical protein
MMGRAVVAERRIGLVAEALAQGPDHARLADPGLAGQQHHLAVAVPGPGPALEQDAELVLATDQRREVLTVQRLEAAFGTTLAFDPPGCERLGEALEPLWAEIGELEQPAHQPAGRLADHDAARRGERLQSSRKVGRLADHRLLLSYALADQLADHDQAGRDPDAGGERLAHRRLQPCERIYDREPGPYRPLGLVLVRPRPAEVGQHAIAHVFGDVPIPALDHLGAATLVGADHLAHVLGVEPRGKLGRADQIAEQYGELPPLGLGWLSALVGVLSGLGFASRARAGRARHPIRERGNRVEQLASMPDRGDAQVLEIVGRQAGQELGIDVVVDKRRRVLPQTQAFEPGRDVHLRNPQPINRATLPRRATTPPLQCDARP